MRRTRAREILELLNRTAIKNVIPCVGLVIAWRWPFIDGAIFTGGILFFFAVEFAVTGSFP